MPQELLTVVSVDEMDMLSMSILVLFLGMFVNRKVRFLAENYIPPAVTGGLMFSTCTALLYSYGDIQLEFDMRLRDLLLLMFFSTVGLSARLRTLVAGGKALVILVLVAAVFLVIQDATGVGLAVLLDKHPGYGLMGGSVSFAGGHGTAIAWGQEAAAAGLTGAKEVGIAFATFGLIFGGIMGGPIARLLLSRNKIEPPAAAALVSDSAAVEEVAEPGDQVFNILRILLCLAVCVSLGDLVNRVLFDRGVLLPGFLTSMGVAIIITNVVDLLHRPLNRSIVDGFGEVSLNVFLSMSMMSMQLWALAAGFSNIIIVLMAQVIVMTLFATFVVFRVMGRDYDAVVMAAGFTGLGLGATPIAIANMDAITRRYGASAKAFLVVPLVGAFFIDLINAAVIKLFINVITRWLI